MGNSGQLGFSIDVCCPNQTISVFFYNRQEGPLQLFEAVPLHSSSYVDGDICAPKGPRAHTMSPPLQGYYVVEGRSLLAEQCFQQALPRNVQMLSDVAEEALNVPTRSEA